MSVTSSKVNPVRRYMFLIEQPPYTDPNGKVIVDLFFDVTEVISSEAIEHSNKMDLRLRFNPRLYPKPLMISGEDLELTAEGLEAYLESMTGEDFIRFIEKAEI